MASSFNHATSSCQRAKIAGIYDQAMKNKKYKAVDARPLQLLSLYVGYYYGIFKRFLKVKNT